MVNPMANADYYKALGVDKKATPDDIKKAFRKLAVKYHPDRNPNDKSAEDKFKEINEAYAVLSDPKKKDEYDTYGSSGFHKQYSQEDIFRGFDFGNAYKDMGAGGAEDIFSRLFGGSFGGGRGAGGRGGFRAGPVKGGDLEMEIDVSFRDAVQGAEKNVAFRRNGKREELKVKIPAGVDNGSKIRIAGKGGKGESGGPDGDLFLMLRVLPDPVFTRDSGDLLVERQIPFSAACLGTSLDVPTLEGDKRIKVPAGIQPGTKIRLKGLGVKTLGSNTKGDLYVKIALHVPEALNAEQARLVEELAKKGM
jgi:curved DNA-binding protein